MAFMKPEWGLRAWPVEVVTLDRVVSDQRLGRVDLVKVDTEGAEADVLGGMRRTLHRDRPVIFCEVLPGRHTEEALEAILRPLDYRYYLLTPEGPNPMQRIRAHHTWLNWLFASLEATCRPPLGKRGMAADPLG